MTREEWIPRTSSAHRLQRGLPGYLILFAPHAFAPQRQLRPSRPPSPPVFLQISTNFTSTPGIPPASALLKIGSSGSTSQVEPRDFTPSLPIRLTPFTPSKSEQRLHPPYYRGCWHGVSRCLFPRYRQPRPSEKSFTTQRPSSPRGVAASGFRPLRKIPHCCLP